MNYDFFAYLNRLKYIKRWPLMRSTVEENVMEHTAVVAIISHALAVIKNKNYAGAVNEEKAVLYALYHETSEVITGDLPTPIKYFNKEINGAYKDIERGAENKLLSTLPEDLRGEFQAVVSPDKDSEEYKIMKCADKIAAYIKCIEEVKSGNKEFVKAKESIKKEIDKMEREEVKFFVKNVLPAYEKTLDELE